MLLVTALEVFGVFHAGSRWQSMHHNFLPLVNFKTGVFGTCRAGHSRSGQVVRVIIESRQISMFSAAYSARSLKQFATSKWEGAASM
jgi:hypothetical protein